MEMPFKLIPAFKDYLWGGNKLKNEYNKNADLDIVAESWEVSTHKDGESIIADGKYKGLKLSEYLKIQSNKCLGNNCKEFDRFPILIKFIDANQSLSIQVHPDDEYALKNEHEYGKTEMWYILEAEKGSFLYYGVKEPISKDELKDRIQNNTLTDILNKVEVKKGDVYFINAGTLHAIGQGIVICEIQQNSNSTYRVYDFNRKDANGNTRELHIDKAIDVTSLFPSDNNADFEEEIIKNDNFEKKPLCICKYFKTFKYEVYSSVSIDINEDSFQAIVVTDGNGKLIFDNYVIEFKKGESIFIPAQNFKYEIRGNCGFIMTQV